MCLNILYTDVILITIVFIPYFHQTYFSPVYFTDQGIKHESDNVGNKNKNTKGIYNKWNQNCTPFLIVELICIDHWIKQCPRDSGK